MAARMYVRKHKKVCSSVEFFAQLVCEPLRFCQQATMTTRKQLATKRKDARMHRQSKAGNVTLSQSVAVATATAANKVFRCALQAENTKSKHGHAAQERASWEGPKGRQGLFSWNVQAAEKKIYDRKNALHAWLMHFCQIAGYMAIFKLFFFIFHLVFYAAFSRCAYCFAFLRCYPC